MKIQNEHSTDSKDIALTQLQRWQKICATLPSAPKATECPACGLKAALDAIAQDLILFRITPEEAEQQCGIPLSEWGSLAHEASSSWGNIKRASVFHKMPYYAQLLKCIEQGKELAFPSEWSRDDAKAYIKHWVWAWMKREPAPPPNRFYNLDMFQSISFIHIERYEVNMRDLVDGKEVDRLTAVAGPLMFLNDAWVILRTELLGEVLDAS